MIKKAIFLYLLSFISHNSYAMFDEIWEDITPNGKHIYYDEGGNGIEYLGDSAKIYHVSKWYFYKGYTIGINQKDSLDYTFFASDELKNKIYQFKDEQSWKQFLSTNDLNPTLVRWHNNSWSLFPVEDSLGGLGRVMLLFIIGIIISIILIILGL